MNVLIALALVIGLVAVIAKLGQILLKPDSPRPAPPEAGQVPRCMGCGYMLTGLPEPRCPECGRPFDLTNPRTFITKPIFIWWQYWLPGFLLAAASGLSLYLILLAAFGYGWATAIVLPFALGAVLGYGCRVGKVALALLCLVLMAAVIAGLFSMHWVGVFCALILGGLAFGPALIGAWIGWALRTKLKRTRFGQRTHLPILLLLLPVMVAVIEGRQTHAPETVVTSTVMDVSADDAFDAVTFYEEVKHPAPWLLRMVLPRSLYATGKSAAVGDVKVCVYSKGRLAKRITRVERGSVLAFDVIEQTQFENHSIRLLNGSFTFEPLGPHETRVTLRTQYEPLLGPRFWWQPAELWATHALHEHVLLGMKLKAQENPRPVIDLRLNPRGMVRLRAEMDLPLTASAVWGQMRGFTQFISLDPFHARIDLPDGPPAKGLTIHILHRFSILRVRRIGRILRWRDGVGYSFSDLSRRGRRRGFPHIFTYEVLPTAPTASRLTVTVRGRWTATFLPRWMVRFWLRWVLGRTVDALRAHLLMLAVHNAARYHAPDAAAEVR